MTEAEWEACRDPAAMLRFLGETASDRKLRLFACGCCRRVWDAFTYPASRQAVRIAERYADGVATDQERRRAEMGAASVRSDQFDPHFDAGDAAWYAIQTPLQAEEVSLSVALDVANNTTPDAVAQTAYASALTVHCRLLRDIFGNPFRPVAFDPAWRTATAVALAEGIYADRAFDRLPILADALQDVGCDNADVLDHCRGPGPHARGCWVVDGVLGKA